MRLADGERCRCATILYYESHESGCCVLRELKTPDGDPVGGEMMPVTGPERMVLAALRKLTYGELRIVMQNSAIVLIEEKKTIKP